MLNKFTQTLGAPDADGLRWCEDITAIGLRFVGWAEVAA